METQFLAASHLNIIKSVQSVDTKQKPNKCLRHTTALNVAQHQARLTKTHTLRNGGGLYVYGVQTLQLTQPDI